MSFSSIQKQIEEKILSKIPGATPGVQIQAHQNGRKIFDIQVGETFPYYDLASLTKIICTSLACLVAYEEKKWNFDSKVKDFVGWFPYANTKIVDLLSHQSGLSWWLPFYQKIDLNLSPLEKWQSVAEIIRKSERSSEKKAIYSDVGFMVLGYFLESIYEKPFYDVWVDLQNRFYSNLSFDFHRDNKPLRPQRLYAPTERCRWRGKTIQGEVHDDNAWALGGVAPHAGLFGSIDDVAWYGLFMRSQLLGISRTVLKQRTVKLFTSRFTDLQVGDWALGWMLPTQGSASCGTYFSSDSFGHTGFTGTSWWFDPRQDLSISILSNRVLIGRDIKNFSILRPLIHNWISEGIRRI